MKRKDIQTSLVKAMQGDDFHVIPSKDDPKYAEKCICKECGKEYLPGSLERMTNHAIKHLVNEYYRGNV